MKRKLLFALLAAEAVFCLLFSFLQARFSGWFSTLVAFPFEQIGAGLRVLSLSGGIGNGIAVVLYIVLSLIPAALFLRLRQREETCKADFLLPVLSVLLFAVLYFMVNPGLFSTPRPGDLLGGTFYSVFCGYLVLRVLSRWRNADTEQLYHGLCVLLYLLIVFFVFVIFSSCFGSLPGAIRSVQESNQADLIYDMEPELTMTYVFLVLKSVVDALPYGLDILVTFAAVRLLDALKADRYSEAAVAASEHLSRLCARALTISVLADIGYHLLQLIASGELLSTAVDISFPLFSVAFVLTALLLARYVRENQQLKRDNDLFI